MGIDGMIKMIETFEFDKRTGIDLPNEKIPGTPKSWMPAVLKQNNGKWPDIRTVYASIGQDTVVMTPIAMIRAIGAVGMRGKEFTPHFLKEFRPISAMGNEGDRDYFAARPGFIYRDPNARIIELKEDQWNLIIKGMWGVVNNGGTAGSIKMANWEIAGKTGTAQVASLGKDVGKNKDHAWFDSFAPAYKPEIAVLALIENSGFGAANAAPAVKAIHLKYLEKRGGVTIEDKDKEKEKDAKDVAKNEVKADPKKRERVNVKVTEANTH